MKIEFFIYGTAFPLHPPNLDIDFNCTWIRNPHALVGDLTGLDGPVKSIVRKTDGYWIRITRMAQRINVLKPARVGFHCFGGKHRSVVVAQDVGEFLRDLGFVVEYNFWNGQVKTQWEDRKWGI